MRREAHGTGENMTAEHVGVVASKRNYFVRHWTGELSLGVSYWINGFLANVLSLVGIFALGAVVGAHPGNYTPLIYWTSAWVFLFALVIWQTTGVWRSADRHIEKTNKT